MTYVLQDQITRMWGYQIVEGDGQQNSVHRVLYEDFSFSSPGEAMNMLTSIQRALNANLVKMQRSGAVVGYQVLDMDQTTVLMSEGGWLDNTETQAHVENIRKSIQGFPKMTLLPQAKRMAINSGNPRSLTSSYTNPETGETKTFGDNTLNINLDRVREEEKADRMAEKDDNARILGE